MRVADLGDALAHELRDIDVGLRRDLARDDHETGRDQRLAGNSPARILAEYCVEDGVGDLVGDLVRVTFGDGLGREEELSRAHRRGDYRPVYWTRRKKLTWNSCVCDAAYSRAERNGLMLRASSAGMRWWASFSANGTPALILT